MAMMVNEQGGTVDTIGNGSSTTYTLCFASPQPLTQSSTILYYSTENKVSQADNLVSSGTRHLNWVSSSSSLV